MLAACSGGPRRPVGLLVHLSLLVGISVLLMCTLCVFALVHIVFTCKQNRRRVLQSSGSGEPTLEGTTDGYAEGNDTISVR